MNTKNKHWRLAGILGVLALALLGGVIATYSPRVSAAPSVQWAPSAINIALKPGQSQTITATITAQSTISAPVLRVVSELAPVLSVSPQAISGLSQGQSLPIALTFNVPIDALPAVTTGTVQLRDGVGGNTIAQPIPVGLNVVWARFADPSAGVGFSYPTYGSVGTVRGESIDFGAAGTGTIYSIAFPTRSTPAPTTQYLITIIGSSQSSAIRDWFTANIDPDQLLTTSGSFVYQQLPNGVELMRLAGPIPDTYDRGPVSEIFAMSPSKKSIITIGTSNDDTMRNDLGLSRDTIQNSYLVILGTINVP